MSGGDETTIDVRRPGELTVIYWFSPTCGWCKRNSANMRALANASGKVFDFVPLSATAEGVAQSFHDNGVQVLAYAEPAEASLAAYGLSGTLQTIVVGADGKVAYSWIGAYREPLASEISSVLGVHLPGLKM